MIKYKSTRGDKRLYSFSEVILKGIAEDGGLFVPERIPKFSFSQQKGLLGKSYQQLVDAILGLFETDFKKEALQAIISSAYSSNFDTSDIVPLVHLKNNQYILELWHGPTSAFKDIALQLTPLLFSEAVKLDNTKRTKRGKKPLGYLILTATSGDTGKAALEGFKDKKQMSIMVFYPDKRVSTLQRIQMVTQEGSNVAVYAVKGDFDTVQKLVKEIFNDQKFTGRLVLDHQTVISSANSINWGRLIPQIIYHVSGYLNLVQKGVIALGQEIDIVVPTGNFGNILAAFYAKKMGLPVRKLVCASNANNVLTEFLRMGVYDVKRRELIQTSSPSMDILLASNIERLLYTITQNSKKVSKWMSDLRTKGKFEVDEITKGILRREFYADWVSNEDCLSNIRKIYDETKYLMDPHTSVAQVVAEQYIKKEQVFTPVIICSTAHWAKFASDVYKALSKSNKTSSLTAWEIINEIRSIVPGTFIPKQISSLRTKKVRFNEKCDSDIEAIKKLILLQISPLNLRAQRS